MKIIHPASLLAIASFCFSAVFAQDKARVIPTGAMDSAAATKQYRAATQSKFAGPEKGRNPFWPIGYVARVKSAPNEEQLLRIPVEQFKVTSIILDTPSIALINGKDYTRGQFLPMTTSTGSVKLLITNIEDGFVTVQYKSIIAKLPITRK